jgi:ribose transport system ATP-binding protein
MRDVTKSFPGVRALSGVSLTVREGEVHALLGENGAGKSTLMNILAGVFPDYGGAIEIDGTPVSIHHPRDASRHGIAMIHQELNLVPDLSVADNIFLGREPRTWRGTVDRSRMRERSRELLAELGLGLDPGTPVRQCRIAEQQLIEIAKALGTSVRVFVMDEPTSALASAEVTRLFGVIRRLASRGVAVIFISHRLEELQEIADNVTVLRDGVLVGTRPMKEASRDELIQLMVGRQLRESFARRPQESETGADATGRSGKKALRVADLHLRGDPRTGRAALHDIGFDVATSEIVGIAGLMGAGRTEVLASIYGAYPRAAVHAEIEAGGRPYRPKSPGHAIRRGFAMVAEDRKRQSLVLSGTVRFNTTLAALRAFTWWGLVRGRRERAEATRVIERLRVKAPGINAVVGNLSGGNQQKVVLARCLLTKPSVLLADEPTRGVDVGAKSEIYAILRELAAGGTAVVMVSSELPELLAVCDRILVLCEGRLTGEFRAAEATQEELMAAAMARESVLTLEGTQ